MIINAKIKLNWTREQRKLAGSEVGLPLIERRARQTDEPTLQTFGFARSIHLFIILFFIRSHYSDSFEQNLNLQQQNTGRGNMKRALSGAKSASDISFHKWHHGIS